MKELWNRPKRMAICSVALISFGAGALVTAAWMRGNQVRADSSRVFEFRVYHALPDKLPALESRFRDTTSQLLAKHDLNVVGYWTVPQDPSPYWNNTFIFMVAHSSLEEAKKNWDAFNADAEFQELIKSEQATPSVTKVERTYMRPTVFSPMK